MEPDPIVQGIIERLANRIAQLELDKALLQTQLAATQAAVEVENESE